MPPGLHSDLHTGSAQDDPPDGRQELNIASLIGRPWELDRSQRRPFFRRDLQGIKQKGICRKLGKAIVSMVSFLGFLGHGMAAVVIETWFIRKCLALK